MKKLVSWCLLAVLGLSLCLSAPAEEASASLCFNKTVWGMGKAQVRWLMGVQPAQEPAELGGPSALVYQTFIEGTECTLQYVFFPGDSLSSVDVIAEDRTMEFYEMVREENTGLYGEPLTGDEDAGEEDDPGALILAGLNQAYTGGAGEYVGWLVDEDKVILLSYDDSISTCYVVLRPYSDFFRSDAGSEKNAR